MLYNQSKLARIIYTSVIFAFLTTVPLYSAESDSTKKGGASSFDFGSLLSHHLMDSVIVELNIGGQKVYADDPRFAKTPFLRRYTFYNKDGRSYRYAGGLPMHLTRRVMQMMVIGGLLVFLAVFVARRITRNPYRISGRFANMIETLFAWCRHDVVDSSMGGHGKGFHSYMITLFFFILLLNLGGLLPPIGEGVEKLWQAFSSHSDVGHVQSHDNHTISPILAFWPGITVTGDISVTFAMAFLAALMIWVTGFRYQGFRYLWQVVPNGTPLLLYVLLWPLEFIVSPVAKAFALTIRLLANMTAGHVIILALMGFIFQSASLWYGGLGSALGALGITFASVLGTVAIYFLEIVVAFLQAFIFTLLTALFVGSAMHRH